MTLHYAHTGRPPWAKLEQQLSERGIEHRTKNWNQRQSVLSRCQTGADTPTERIPKFIAQTLADAL